MSDSFACTRFSRNGGQAKIAAPEEWTLPKIILKIFAIRSGFGRCSGITGRIVGIRIGYHKTISRDNTYHESHKTYITSLEGDAIGRLLYCAKNSLSSPCVSVHKMNKKTSRLTAIYEPLSDMPPMTTYVSI